MDKKKIKIGIGFATGRKHFRRVLRSHVYNWMESDLIDNKDLSLNLFVAYDLDYRDTKRSDYTRLGPDIRSMFDSSHFIGSEEVAFAAGELAKNGVITEREAALLFGKGYAAQRNILLYYAIKNGMDCLLFLDDDEYPVAVTKNRDQVIWGGQQVLKSHLKEIGRADITYGHHCGYISPIPYIPFTGDLNEKTFSLFIKALSNDILNWPAIKRVMDNGGVTYADTGILQSGRVEEVREVNRAKFISGSNLCINLTDPNRVFPFYNPPGARGEDTFLSTCLKDRTVLRVPCYAFHDGFAAYQHLSSGVLPTRLNFISADNDAVTRRFYHACIGWMRYKPLLTYVTDPENYRDRIDEIARLLDKTLPSVCRYFGSDSFSNIVRELHKYDRAVSCHCDDFENAKEFWARIMRAMPQPATARIP